ncbi:MAG: hypothetical protein MK080_14165, partial [Opitutales bacterium]|nr:hypothetical protein [Opitutales bacterium]
CRSVWSCFYFIGSATEGLVDLGHSPFGAHLVAYTAEVFWGYESNSGALLQSYKTLIGRRFVAAEGWLKYIRV